MYSYEYKDHTTLYVYRVGDVYREIKGNQARRLNSLLKFISKQHEQRLLALIYLLADVELVH